MSLSSNIIYSQSVPFLICPNLFLLSFLTISLSRTFTTRRRLAGVINLGISISFDKQAVGLTPTDTPSVITINYADVATWHSRLGHLSDQRLAILQDKLHCNVHSIHKNKICWICPLAKQKRLPFVSYNKMASSPFELVHCDIWGPFHIISHTGHQFFVTLVDDYTRFTWTFLLKHKSDVQLIVPRFVKMIHTQFERKIKAFRSDNARELAFTEFFNEQGILHQYSC